MTSPIKQWHVPVILQMSKHHQPQLLGMGHHSLKLFPAVWDKVSFGGPKKIWDNCQVLRKIAISFAVQTVQWESAGLK